MLGSSRRLNESFASSKKSTPTEDHKDHLPGTVPNTDFPEVESSASWKKDAAAFRTEQSFIQTSNYQSAQAAIQILESKNTTREQNCCCNVATGICCDRNKEGIADLLACCIIGSCCGAMGFFAKMINLCQSSPSVINLTPDESQSLQQSLDSLEINNIEVSTTLTMKQYDELCAKFINIRDEIDYKRRLRTSPKLSIFYSATLESSIEETKKEALLQKGSLDLIAEYFGDPEVPSRHTI